MFKERFFLFELGTPSGSERPTVSGSDRPTSGSERPTVSEDQVEEQMAKITEALMYRFAISLLIPKFFNKKKTSPNHFLDALYDLKPIVEKKFREGYKFKEFQDDKMVIVWEIDGQEVKEINPFWSHEAIEKRLLPKTIKKLAKLKASFPVSPYQTPDETAEAISDEAISSRTEATNTPAEDLVRHTSSIILIDLFGSKYEDAMHKLGPKFNELYDEIELNLSEGWKYKGIKAFPEDMVIIWQKPTGKQALFSLGSYVTPEEQTVLIEMLSPENRAAMAKEKENSIPPEQKAKKFITDNIFPFIKKKRPKLKKSVFWKSWLFKAELSPILEAGYQAKKPYKFRPKSNGFILKGAGKNLLDQPFDLSLYDENLNFIENPVQNEIEKLIKNSIIPLAEKHYKKKYNDNIFQSFMIKEEVEPILYAGHKNKDPFKIRAPRKPGFVLLNSSTRYEFNFENYDENLNPYAPGVSPDEKPPAKTTDKVGDQKKPLDDSKTATDQLDDLPPDEKPPAKTTDKVDDQKKSLDDLPPDEKFEDNEDVYQETDEEREKREERDIQAQEERKTENKAIENAMEDYYSDELESLKEMASNEILTNENLDDLEADMASLSEKAGLSDLHDLLVDFFKEVSEKIDSGEITTQGEFYVFSGEYMESSGIQELIDLILSEAETEEDLIYVKAAITILEGQYELMERFMLSELEDDGDE